MVLNNCIFEINLAVVGFNIVLLHFKLRLNLVQLNHLFVIFILQSLCLFLKQLFLLSGVLQLLVKSVILVL